MSKKDRTLEEEAERISLETGNPCIVIDDEIIMFGVPDEKEGENDGSHQHGVHEVPAGK